MYDTSKFHHQHYGVSCKQITTLNRSCPHEVLRNIPAFHYRPASTDKVDDDAMVIGIPAGSFSQDVTIKEDSYFFVVLRSPQSSNQRQALSPIKGLKMGPQLGAGRSLPSSGSKPRYKTI